MSRRICVVTGSRADYGLLSGLMRRIREHPGLQLQIAATGMHLAGAFGDTWRAIVDDGFEIDAKVECLLASDTPTAIAKAVAIATGGFADAFERLRPDLIVVLGDRFEILAAAQAALFLRIPLAHAHGGELTEGAIDDSIRHAITKFAQLHFVACEEYRRRVIQLGEAPEQVWNVGALGIDNLFQLDLPDRDALLGSLSLPTDRPFLLLTYHPETLADLPAAEQIERVLAALDRFPEFSLVVTGVNADSGHAAIAQRLAAYAAGRERVRLVASLGQARYLAALRNCAAVVGNSSSGIIEAPAAGAPTVNIGGRQGGRLRSPSIIDSPIDALAIAAALQQALSPEFAALANRRESRFGNGKAAERMVRVLAAADLEGLTRKHFHDLPDISGEPT